MKKIIATICLLSVLFTMFAGFSFAAQKHPDDCTCEKCIVCVKDKGLECHCPICTYSPDWGGKGGDEA